MLFLANFFIRITDNRPPRIRARMLLTKVTISPSCDFILSSKPTDLFVELVAIKCAKVTQMCPNLGKPRGIEKHFIAKREDGGD